MNERAREEAMARIAGRSILVVGDYMLDGYVFGTVRRISPEAPVPVIEVAKRRFLPGGAANTASNITSLGSRAIALGVVGKDAAGRRLRRALARSRIALDGMVEDDDRPTTTKTRVIAQHQQVVRIDHEKLEPLSYRLQERCLAVADEFLPGVDGCIICDYQKGVVTDWFAARLLELCLRHRVPVVVDPKGRDYEKYQGATVLKPNEREAGEVLNQEVTDEASLAVAGSRLLTLLPGSAVLITRGARGMSLFRHAREPVHIATEARDVFDVTGAGDTVAAVLGTAIAAGVDLESAARMANRAAGVVVGKVGAYCVKLDDLRNGAAAKRTAYRADKVPL